MSLDGVVFPNYMWRRSAKCVLEQTIDRLTAELRSKPKWRRKIKNWLIVEKWRKEATHQGIADDEFEFAMKVHMLAPCSNCPLPRANKCSSHQKLTNYLLLAPCSNCPLPRANKCSSYQNLTNFLAVADAVVRDHGHGERDAVSRPWRVRG